jgi:hypothetical protein
MAEAQDSAGGGPESPKEEELRAQLEEEIRRVAVGDVVLQSAVSILNLAARRIAKDDERDLEQGKLGIDAAGSLVDHVSDDAQPQLRQAISELKLLYAKQAGGGEAGSGETGEGGSATEAPAPEPEPKPAAQEREGPGLWTPPGS